MRQRDPERVIKLYDWLSRRGSKSRAFGKPLDHTLTGRCFMQLSPRRLAIRKAMMTPEFRDAISKIIHSN
jgi:hypothetical protein